ncbi:MAG TPA: serine/threonine-protein kinase [Rubricoccaceae bacterium]|nr:serine/threonine-protein kinase [Rubricoccaceae bacterium]
MATLSDDPVRWHAVKALFEEAVSRPVAERAAFLDAADGALRADVEALLAADTEAGSFLYDAPAAVLLDVLAESGPEEVPSITEGEVIGPYRVLRRLGEGGMGEVFLAERADGAFAQTVALKLVKRGMDTAAVLRRFHAERRILARLEHPGIARLLDGGATPDGRPWFAMEYVAGEPITTYTDRHTLGLDARLSLFEETVEAVRHAHARLVVHRDLKPSNVLVAVDEQGRPRVKLLDFGIARLLGGDEEGSEATTLTAAGVRPMTRAYAAPEQLRSEAITTATDVYALGVLLYELLTGRRPFEAPTPTALEEAILTREPVRPSAALRAADRAAYRRLRGDLDTICLKALRKEPEARYASADALLEDVRRYRAGLPVTARPPTVGYRVRTFVRRHPAGVAASVAVALLVLGGGAFYTVRVTAERDRARAAATRAEQVSATLAGLFEGADPTVAQGDTLTAYDLLARGAARVETELAGQPDVQADLYLVISRAYENLGVSDRAVAFARHALVLRRRAAPANVASAEVRLGQALAAANRFEVADSLLRAAGRRARARGDTETLIEALEALGRTRLTFTDSPERVGPPLEQAVALRRAHYGPNDPGLGPALYTLALAQHLTGDFDRAEALFREALAVERRAPGKPLDLANTLFELGQLLHFKRQYAEAQPLLEEALALRTRVYGSAHRAVADVHALLGVNAIGLRRAGDGERHLRTALALHERTDGPRSESYLDDLLKLRLFLTEFGRHAEALDVARQALPLVEAVHGRESVLYANTLAMTAWTLSQNGRYAEAEAAFAEAFPLLIGIFGADNPQVAMMRLNAGHNAEAAGRLALAEQRYAEVWAVVGERLPATNARRAEAAYDLGRLRARRGAHAEAAPLLRAAADARTALDGYDPEERSGTRALHLLGASFLALGRAEEAEPVLAAAHAALLDAFGPDHEATRAAQADLAACRRALRRPPARAMR